MAAPTPSSSADFAVTSKLVNIDVPGYGQPTKNRLRLFDLASVDDGLVPGSSIDFDKTETPRTSPCSSTPTIPTSRAAYFASIRSTSW